MIASSMSSIQVPPTVASRNFVRRTPPTADSCRGVKRSLFGSPDRKEMEKMFQKEKDKNISKFKCRYVPIADPSTKAVPDLIVKEHQEYLQKKATETTTNTNTKCNTPSLLTNETTPPQPIKRPNSNLCQRTKKACQTQVTDFFTVCKNIPMTQNVPLAESRPTQQPQRQSFEVKDLPQTQSLQIECPVVPKESSISTSATNASLEDEVVQQKRKQE